MRLHIILAVGLLTIAISSVGAWADIIVSSTPGAGFLAMPAPAATGSGLVADPNQPGAAYWDHQSQDATNSSSTCNIGYQLTGTALGCANQNGSLASGDPAPLGYWALNGAGVTGDYDPSFTFATAGDVVELEMSVAGFATAAMHNTFGWYDTSSPNILHPLFTADQTQATADIPAGNIGFYLSNPLGSTFYSQSQLNSGSDAGIQHFTVFTNTAPAGNNVTNYYIGVEDMGGAHSDFDFNDMIVHVIDPDPVPEPGTVLLCLALSGAALALWRRFAR